MQSCIHCHQIGDAQRQFYREKTARSRAGAVPVSASQGAWPDPRSEGVATVPCWMSRPIRRHEGRLSKRATRFNRSNGQPLLSMADVQWVLHHVPAGGGMVKAVVKRERKASEVALELPTAGETGRHCLAGFQLGTAPDGPGAQCFSKPLSPGAAGRAEAAGSRRWPSASSTSGQFAPHDVAKKAGVLKEDVLISFNGRTDFQRETDSWPTPLNELARGTKVPAVFLRNGEKINVELVTH